MLFSLTSFGPTTVRDTVGSLGNVMGGDAWYNITAGKDTQHVSDVDYWGSRGTDWN